MGTYLDKEKGAKLDLQQTEWTLTLVDGHVLTSKVETMDVEALKKAKDGVYILENPVDKNLLDVFFAKPVISTQQSDGGLLWFDSELAYTLLPKDQKDDVKSVDIFHCLDGRVEIDTLTNNWQIGCPAGAKTYHFQRVEK